MAQLDTIQADLNRLYPPRGVRAGHLSELVAVLTSAAGDLTTARALVATTMTGGNVTTVQNAIDAIVAAAADVAA